MIRSPGRVVWQKIEVVKLVSNCLMLVAGGAILLVGVLMVVFPDHFGHDLSPLFPIEVMIFGIGVSNLQFK